MAKSVISPWRNVNAGKHSQADGSTPGDRLLRQGYSWTFIAENLACGYPTAAEVVQGWLSSPGHRTNMLAQDAREIGVGLVFDPSSECVYYWSAIFAAPEEKS